MLLRMCKCVMVISFVWLTSSKSEEEALGGISLKEGGDAAGHSFVAFVNEFLSQVTVNLLCCQALLSWQGTVDEMRKLRQNKRENCYYRPGLNLSLCMSEKLGSWDIYATLWNVTATHTHRLFYCLGLHVNWLICCRVKSMGSFLQLAGLSHSLLWIGRDGHNRWKLGIEEKKGKIEYLKFPVEWFDLMWWCISG